MGAILITNFETCHKFNNEFSPKLHSMFSRVYLRLVRKSPFSAVTTKRQQIFEMADESGFVAVERERFEQCYNRFMNFISTGDDISRANLNLLLDEINSIDYSSKIVREEVK